MADDLVKFHALIQDLFVRRAQREWNEFYVRGQLSDLARKTAEPMVLQLKGTDTAAVRTRQQFLSLGTWHNDPILWRLEELIAEDLGETDASVILDGSGCPKQGTHSVGVVRQYGGYLDKIANCQYAVFATYTSSRGYTLLDRRLYRPEQWFDEAHTSLRTRYGVPDELQFTTAPQLGRAMVKGLLARGNSPFRWVLADEAYGADPKFLDGIEALGKWSFVEVSVSTMLWGGAVEVEAAGQGPLGHPRQHARVAAETQPRLEARATAAGLPERAGRRYRITEGAKGAVGMDHDEGRRWRGWPHQMTQTVLADYVLVRLRGKTPALTLPQAKRLLSAVLPEKNLTVGRALASITCRQARNSSAYHAHRCRTDARHRRRQKPPQLKDPSL